MVIKTEISLRDFEFWSGAKSNAELLTPEELDLIDEYLQDIVDEILTETELNDFMWFETETIADWLNYSSWEELFNERSK